MFITNLKRRRRHLQQIRKRKLYSHVRHVDEPFIQQQIDGHGGSYEYKTQDGIIQVGYIGHRSKLYVFRLNIKLFVRYIKRKYHKERNILKICTNEVFPFLQQYMTEMATIKNGGQIV